MTTRPKTNCANVRVCPSMTVGGSNVRKVFNRETSGRQAASERANHQAMGTNRGIET